MESSESIVAALKRKRAVKKQLTDNTSHAQAQTTKRAYKSRRIPRGVQRSVQTAESEELEEHTTKRPYKSRRIPRAVQLSVQTAVSEEVITASQEQAKKRQYKSKCVTPSVQPPTENASNSKKQQRAKKQKIPAALGGKTVPTEPSKLKSPTFCKDCGAKKFQYEAEGLCCCSGDVC